MYNGSHTNNSTSSIGSYYNARVANALSASASVSAKDYTTNICPKNWTLPTYSQIKVLTNTPSTYYTPFAPVLAGYRKNNSYDQSGTGGNWWSRTAKDSTNFHLLFAHSNTLTTNPNVISFGLSVRCLAI